MGPWDSYFRKTELRTISRLWKNLLLTQMKKNLVSKYNRLCWTQRDTASRTLAPDSSSPQLIQPPGGNQLSSFPWLGWDMSDPCEEGDSNPNKYTHSYNYIASLETGRPCIINVLALVLYDPGWLADTCLPKGWKGRGGGGQTNIQPVPGNTSGVDLEVLGM